MTSHQHKHDLHLEEDGALKWMTLTRFSPGYGEIMFHIDTEDVDVEADNVHK